ncbi:MAG: IS1595 family transposase [Chitinophagales bacterium]
MKTFKNLVECVEYFKDEDVCLRHLAEMRWKHGIACPHCGSVRFYSFANGRTYKCAEKECRKKFNAKTKTIFENTKIPLSKWFCALYLITSHKKGISSIQVGKDLSVTQKTAWFMMHRLRYMFLAPKLAKPLKGIVEIDETYVGGKLQNKHQQYLTRMTPTNRKKAREERRKKDKKGAVIGIVGRKGLVITKHVENIDKASMLKIVYDNIDVKAHIMTDEANVYKFLPYLGYKHNFVTPR